MRKSLRSQDKSIYLAFALSPSISLDSFYDQENSQNRKFHFQLCKGNDIIEKTSTVGVDYMKKQNQMYLYLSLPQYAQKLDETYSIKLVEERGDQLKTLLEEKINLDYYIHQHNTQERDFWTEILKSSTQNEKIVIMQRVFLKRTKFQLQDIINSSQKGEQYDVVDIPEQLNSSKFGIDRRKSKSYQTTLNSLISPKRLDTISEEDSIIPLTEKKQTEELEKNKLIPHSMSASFKKKQKYNFEDQLQKGSTWIQKNSRFDDEFVAAFDGKHQDKDHQKRQLRDDKGFVSDLDMLKVKSMNGSEISQKGSKISKNTKDSQKQFQDNQNDNSISFLDKSSLLMDMSRSELDISPDDQVCFKLKWIILVVVVLGLAVLASLSTDAFDIAETRKKNKAKGYKKKGQKASGKLGKNNREKNVKQIHA